VPYEKTNDLRLKRAISWDYQMEIVRQTPKPKRWTTVRLEDFVLDQDATLRKLEPFLGMPLVKIAVKPEVVGRWKDDKEKHDFKFFEEDMREHGYLADKKKRPRKAKV
jgi:hypothetical protein